MKPREATQSPVRSADRPDDDEPGQNGEHEDHPHVEEFDSRDELPARRRARDLALSDSLGR